jgi:GPH family glycoside/pentoside/hexuronide:cation symporter
MSLFSVPWGALGLSLTPDYHERTRLMATNAFWCAAAAVILSWLYALIKLPVFPDSITGVRWVSAGMAFLMSGLALVAVVFCRERQTTAQATRQPEPALPQIKAVLANRAFLIVGSIVFFMCLGVFSISSLPTYIAIY